MALTVNSIMSGVMSNPDVAAVGLVAGFILAKAMGMRKKRGMGMGGGFP
jgi:hypothetical protein